MAIKTYPKNSTAKVSPNFRVKEFTCKCSRCTEVKIDEKLVAYLQQIRDHFEKPVNITSSYRCPQHNAEVKNASKNSQHTKGKAADIVIKGVEPAEIAKYAESIGVLGIGLYDTDLDGHFVHIDTRSNKSFWFGHAQQRRVTFGGAPTYSLEAFVNDLRRVFGVPTSEEALPGILGRTVAVGAKYNNKHECIKYIQQRLLALGYDEVGKADGSAGPKFTSALAHFQQEHDCTPTGIAEEWGKTWHQLLTVTT